MSDIDTSSPLRFLKTMRLKHYESMRDFFLDLHDQVDELNHEKISEILRLKQELTKLRTALKDCAEALEFYGDKESWSPVNVGYGDRIVISNCDRLDLSETDRLIEFGGKRAREALSKHQDIINSAKAQE